MLTPDESRGIVRVYFRSNGISHPIESTELSSNRDRMKDVAIFYKISYCVFRAESVPSKEVAASLCGRLAPTLSAFFISERGRS